ncbi:MAG: hypothetical protein J0H74_36490 [Chitinophagaceae bacterium]|nr:hypothetical protein [Chitinophagaceae bacterium]
MEKIYIVKEQIDTRIIGRSYPQVSSADDPLLDKENMKRVREDKFTEVPVNGYHVRIQKSTKLTDYISSFLETHTPILSQRLLRLLQTFRLPSHQLVPVQVYRGKEQVEEAVYRIVNFSGNDIQNINFPQSTFDYFTGGATLDKSLLHFSNYEDYRNKVAKDDRVEMAIIQKVVMKPSLPHDLFFLGIFKASAFFVRQGLKEAMDQEKITGFRFDEVGYIAE